jgi:hypothetical protein
MSKPIFFDPDRRRWKRIRKTIDVTVVVLSVLIVFFAITVVRKTSIPKVLLADQKKNYRALKQSEKKPQRKGTHRKTQMPPSQVVLNSGEGIRGAFYVTWDAASYSSLREYIHQIDFVFPEWLHVLTPDGRLQAISESNSLYYAINNGHVSPIDLKLMPLIKSTNSQVDVLPLVNNFDPVSNEWRTDIKLMLASKDGREHFREEIRQFLASDNYKGLTLDL